jgi:hypothetical protein
MGPRASLDAMEYRKMYFPCRESNHSCIARRYADWDIPARYSFVLIYIHILILTFVRQIFRLRFVYISSGIETVLQIW